MPVEAPPPVADSVPEPVAAVASSGPTVTGIKDNNYSRPSGQNVGNFITDKPSSRVLAPPGPLSCCPSWVQHSSQYGMFVAVDVSVGFLCTARRFRHLNGWGRYLEVGSAMQVVVQH